MRRTRRSRAGEFAPLTGIPLAIKDLFCTEGVRTTAGSRILEPFVPPYESTVSANLLRDGAVFLGKANMDEFAMGSSNMTSAYGPVANPWKRRQDQTAVLVPGGSSGGSAAAVVGAAGDGGDRHRHRRLDPPAGVVLRHRRDEADLWAVLALGRGGVRVVARSSRAVRAHGARTARSCSARWRGTIRRIPPAPIVPVPDFEAACRRDVKGLRIGVPREYRMDGMPEDIERLWRQGLDWLRDAGAEIVDVSLPHTKYGLTTYYIVAPAEASSNLARYDGVRFGLRENGADLRDLYERTRAAGFGAEVRRRVLIGTYVLSAGYYDAYYLRAQKVRALILRDFTEVFARVDALVTPDRAVGGVRAGREHGRSDQDVSERRVHRAGQHGGRAGYLGAGRARRRTVCRSACR